MNFKDEVDIDRYQLDTELIRQPQKFYDWAIKAAKATKEKDDAKHDLDIIRANVEKRIRRNPQKYGIDNVTEGAIKLEITRHHRVKKYTKRYIDACYNERVLTEARTAFAQRKNMLQDLTQLNVQLHFAEVPMPHQLKQETYKSARKRIRAKLNKKNKIKRRK